MRIAQVIWVCDVCSARAEPVDENHTAFPPGWETVDLYLHDPHRDTYGRTSAMQVRNLCPSCFARLDWLKWKK